MHVGFQKNSSTTVLKVLLIENYLRFKGESKMFESCWVSVMPHFSNKSYQNKEVVVLAMESIFQLDVT